MRFNNATGFVKWLHSRQVNVGAPISLYSVWKHPFLTDMRDGYDALSVINSIDLVVCDIEEVQTDLIKVVEACPKALQHAVRC